MKNFLYAILITQLLSCSSTTVIKSSDPGTTIKVNGKVYGTGNIVYSDRKIALLGSKNRVQLSKKGCLDSSYKFKRNEVVEPIALITGIFLIAPLLWIMKYKAVHEYQFKCTKKAAI